MTPRGREIRAWRSPWRHRPMTAGIALLRHLLALVRIDERPLLRRLVRDNNRRVRRHLRRSPPRSVLLIVPRCVQRGCRRVDRGGSLAPCLTCRECPLGDLARLADRRGLEALVAYRSHIAFAMARERRPDLILAAACEDRLIKALRSVPEIPALLSPLGEMVRPCSNAVLDLDWFARELARLPVAPSPSEEVPRARSARAGL